MQFDNWAGNISSGMKSTNARYMSPLWILHTTFLVLFSQLMQILDIMQTWQRDI